MREKIRERQAERQRGRIRVRVLTNRNVKNFKIFTSTELCQPTLSLNVYYNQTK